MIVIVSNVITYPYVPSKDAESLASLVGIAAKALKRDREDLPNVKIGPTLHSNKHHDSSCSRPPSFDESVPSGFDLYTSFSLQWPV